MTDAVVLGAGMVGVGTALALQARGKSVVLLDKTEPGSETSYGNAGIIQAEAREPYAIPLDFSSLLEIISGQGNAISYHAGGLLENFKPLLRYFYYSMPGQHKEISKEYARIIGQAIDDHSGLIEAAGCSHLIGREGYRQAYRSEKALADAWRDAERYRQDYSVPSHLEDNAQLHQAEPGLKREMAGAVHWTGSWACRDPGGLVKAYADLFTARGGTYVQGDALTLERQKNGWVVSSEEGPLTAAHAIIALGPWSSEMLVKLGYQDPLFSKRGYHQHFAYAEGQNVAAPKLPMMDVANAAVICPTTYGVRICSGAEIARKGAPPSPRQLVKAIKSAKELFDLGEPVEETPWYGNRPCMPDMLPVVGKAPNHEGLWFNFGHGHQGFTLGPTTGRLLAEEITEGISQLTALSPLHRIK